MSMTLDQAAEARATGARDATARPSQRRSMVDADSSTGARLSRAFEVRADTETGAPIVEGFASVTGEPYEMYDMFGPYVEVVEVDAFDQTLATDPLVEFTLNHGAGGGIPMAHTRNGTLTLSIVKDAEVNGLWYGAGVDGSRHDVSDALKAMKRGDLAESSFKFRIDLGQWSPDWQEYHIKRVDIHRGDVSAVNFGANPLTSVGVRSSGLILPPAETARRVLISEVDCRPRVIAI